MTTTSSPTTPNAGQMILAELALMRQDMTAILELARSTALPMEGETTSVLDAMVSLLQMTVAGIEHNRQAIQALHQRLDEPGIALTLRRMIETD